MIMLLVGFENNNPFKLGLYCVDFVCEEEAVYKLIVCVLCETLHSSKQIP
jgi:hypothetical protein